MNNKYKIIVLLFFLFCNCTKKEDVGKELITQNINILIDSIETFDMSKIKRPLKFKDVQIEKPTVALLNNIVKDPSNSKKPSNYIYTKISQNEIVNFKSKYKLILVKNVSGQNNSYLYIIFSNLNVDSNNATIIVKKIMGISMIKSKYYFKKQNGVWVFKKKEIISIG